MRVLSVLTVITTVSFALVTAASTKFDAPTSRSDIELATRVSVDHNQVNRVLRRFIPNDEERGVVDKVDDVVTKLDDVTGIRKVDDATGKAKVTSHLDTLMLKNLHELSEQGALGIKLSSKYKNAGQLSLPTLRQLDEIEILKKADVAKYSKETGKSMRREIPDFPGKKTAPAKFLESHVGRDQQRYGADGSRLLASAVVYDPVTERVLLISSSNPNKNELLTIKGGWDYGENVEKAALREVMEEGGVGGSLMRNLGEMKFSEGTNKYTYYSYLVKSNTVYDDWAESARYRVWVSFNDAMILLAKRDHMVQIVKKAKEAARNIKAGEKMDSNLLKVTLD